MKIEATQISKDQPPYLIAEISANHNGSIQSALELIQQAKNSGASAVKLQTYTADTLTLNLSSPDFTISGGLWAGRSLHDLYSEAHTPWVWHEDLFNEARRIGITIFSSPFDSTAVELLEGLGAPAYKIASFEILDLELIRTVASTGKPLIMSTGLASLREIEEAYGAALDSGASEVALLHCLSSYPAPISEYKLGSIAKLAELFNCEVGLSDHTIGNDIAIASIALGATIVEKHFTLNTSGVGPDDSFSMDSQGLLQLRKSVDAVWESLGFDDFKIQPSELENIRFRRSLYFVRNLSVGEIITRDHVRSIRPGFGIPPKHISELLGKKSPSEAVAGERVTHEFLEMCRLD